MKWNLYGMGDGFTNVTTSEFSNYNIEMRGYDRSLLDKKVKEAAQLLLKNRRIRDIDRDAKEFVDDQDRSEYLIKIDNKKIVKNNINIGALNLKIQRINHNVGLVQELLIDSSVVRFATILPNSRNHSVWEFMNTPMLVDSRYIKMNDIPSAHLVNRNGVIRKRNRLYTRTLGFNYFGSVVIAHGFLNKAIDEINRGLPNGYSAIRSHPYKFNESSQSRIIPFLLILVAVYFSAVLFFDNATLPLIPLFLSTLSLSGAFLAFGYFGHQYNEGGFLSLLFTLCSAMCYNIFVIYQVKNADSTMEKNLINIHLAEVASTLIISFIVFIVMISILGFPGVGFSLASSLADGILWSLPLVVVSIILCSCPRMIKVHRSSAQNELTQPRLPL